jgi:hypothetical protein
MSPPQVRSRIGAQGTRIPRNHRLPKRDGAAIEWKDVTLGIFESSEALIQTLILSITTTVLLDNYSFFFYTYINLPCSRLHGESFFEPYNS